MAVYVVGSINVDLVAYAERMPRLGETVLGTGFERHPGGKGANQAIAAARAGVESLMVGAVGGDPFGEMMRETLSAGGVDVGRVEIVDTATGVALIMVAGGENRIIVVPGANHRIGPARVEELDFRPGDVCMAQLEIPLPAVRAAFARARSRQTLAVLNPAPALLEAGPLLASADVIVANETECALLAGIPVEAIVAGTGIETAGSSLGLRPEQVLVVTLGAAGVRALASGRVIAVPGHAVEAVDTTGAGDCFCGYLAAELSRGERLTEALYTANAAAALAVQTRGAATGIPARAEVERFLAMQAGVASAPVWSKGLHRTPNKR